MNTPSVELIPLRAAVCSDAETTLDLLIRITPPVPEQKEDRPPVNLGLVLDRSGSMAERNKITYAREAAAFAITHLRSGDRASITIFDNEVETLVPNAPVADKDRIISLIQSIQPRGSTALHDGWKEGGKQVSRNQVARGLNRVLLLSDGLANVGETRPDAICDHVHRLATEKVSTTTMGLGDDYNEDLLEAMARSGDGNYYYIESPVQLADIFQTELKGLMATIGRDVLLGFSSDRGVQVEDMLNDNERTPEGKWKLPSLIAGMPQFVVLRLKVPPQSSETELCWFELTWETSGKKGRQSLGVALRLPVAEKAAWESLPENAEVKERVTLLLLARHKRVASARMAEGDFVGTARYMSEMDDMLKAAPGTPEVMKEMLALGELQEDFKNREQQKFAKRAKWQSHQRQQSISYPDETEDEEDKAK